MIIRCKYCNIELTDNLVEVEGIEKLNDIDGKDLIPKGQFSISNGDYYTGTEKHIIINLKDLKNSKNHTDTKRLNGCCGLDGLDGPNKVCLNGHEIGTEKSDCWMAHSMILDNNNIVML